MSSSFCYNHNGDKMKVIFASDIHGNVESLNRLLNICNNELPDRIIFLGDMFYGSYSISSEIEDLLSKFYNPIIIRGNCDRYLEHFGLSFDFLDYYYCKLFNKMIFASHGDIYNISNLPEKDFDILIYGHTHKGMIIKKDNKYYLNPGSISYPRGGSVCSFILMDDSGIYLKDLDNNIIDKSLW